MTQSGTLVCNNEEELRNISFRIFIALHEGARVLILSFPRMTKGAKASVRESEDTDVPATAAFVDMLEQSGVSKEDDTDFCHL